MAEKGSTFKIFPCIDSSYIYDGKDKVFLPEDAVNVPRNEEDATKCFIIWLQ